MREIKFRAWDGKQMHLVLEEEHKYKSRYVNSMISDPDLILLQYTGLKDKNGVEIYEGDIVKVEGNSVPQQIKFGDYQTELEHIICWYFESDLQLGRSALSLATPCKVIGNIYENPELLEDKK